MRYALPLVALSAMLVTAGAAPAQPRGASIPRQFHGAWAPSPRACRDRGPSTEVVTIDRRGWTSFEEGARVTRYTQVRRGVHWFRIVSYGGADENPGTLALRRDGNLLALTETVAGQTRNQHLVRCR